MIAMRLTLVATSRDTRDGMHLYLSRLGAEVRSTSELGAAVDMAKGAKIVVVFADDYEREQAARAVRSILAPQGRPGVIVVTAEMERFRAALGAHDRGADITFLCRPVWGWAMVDAIREQLTRRKPKKGDR
jgi:DNA-binding response OmpR family regulator